MKKIKVLGIIVLAAVIVFGMTSCGDDPGKDPVYDNDPDDLIGSWYAFFESGDTPPLPLKRVETYNADGTIDSDLYKGEDFKDHVAKDSYSYKYSATKSTITFDWGKGKVYSCNYQIEGKKLTIYWEEDGEVEEDVWTRVE